MLKIQLGIAYEGELDIEPIEVLIKKVISDPSIELQIKKKVSPRTGIIGFVSSYTKIFFLDEGVDIAIYLTDQDVSKTIDDRKNSIVEKIKEVNPAYDELSVVGVCNPHFEAWLIADENTVKRIFNVEDHSLPLPCKDKLPKEQIANLRNNMRENKLTQRESYLSLAESLDIEKVKGSCPDFKLFCDDLIRTCNYIKTVKAGSSTL